MDNMGNTLFLSSGSPLECILRNWEKFDPENLKRERLIFFCNMSWLQNKLGDREVWPENGSGIYNTLLQLDVFCKRLGK